MRWKWGESYATGKVEDSFEQRVTRTLKGSKVTKNGSAECPAYLIEQDDGTQVLKLESEIERSN